MNEKTNNICVAMKLQSGNLNSIKVQMNEAQRMGATLLEYRMDYYIKVENLPLEFFVKLAEITPLPIIFTMRNPKEGGNLEISEDKRIQIIRKLIKAQPQFVDIEVQTKDEHLKELYNLAKLNGVNIVYSYHDFEKTPPKEEAFSLMERLIEKCPSLNEENGENVLKIIFKANSREDNYIPIGICEELNKRGIRSVSFCMGKKGEFSRVFSIKHGAYFSFASIGTRTAPGQLKLAKFLEMLEIGEEKIKENLKI